ncbi:cAMP-dependent protein kinase subunit [Blyttiomyces sp. JEL0837]|nr:cAMP-dependent protein kinase subunit [Blyttiomyces sp. JEL0837]
MSRSCRLTRTWDFTATFLLPHPRPPPPSASQSLSLSHEYPATTIPTTAHGHNRTALIILNQPICALSYLERIWSSTSIHVCADGGANRLYDGLGNDRERTRFLPDEIRGDLDSLRPDVREWYAGKGVSIVHISDQDSTDFGKCVRLIQEIESKTTSQLPTSTSTQIPSVDPTQNLPIPPEREPEPQPNTAIDQTEPPSGLYDIIALGAVGGRFDQTIASIHKLFVIGSQRKVYLVSNESIVVLLTPEYKHQIICDRDIEGPTCGVMPIGVSVANVVTTGLKWNIVSTSNAFADKEETDVDSNDDNARLYHGRNVARITVDTNAPVVWSVECDLR